MLVVKCMKCSEKKNILFELEEWGEILQLTNRMRMGKCPICGFKILIEGG